MLWLRSMTYDDPCWHRVSIHKLQVYASQAAATIVPYLLLVFRDSLTCNTICPNPTHQPAGFLHTLDNLYNLPTRWPTTRLSSTYQSRSSSSSFHTLTRTLSSPSPPPVNPSTSPSSSTKPPSGRPLCDPPSAYQISQSSRTTAKDGKSSTSACSCRAA
jgi:hypothetical protein